MTEVLSSVFCRDIFCGKFFSMKRHSIADCYIHYGKLGREIIDICAKKHLNILIIKVSFIISKQNKMGIS